MNSKQHETTRTLRPLQSLYYWSFHQRNLQNRFSFILSDDTGKALINLSPMISEMIFAKVNLNWIFNLNNIYLLCNGCICYVKHLTSKKSLGRKKPTFSLGRERGPSNCHGVLYKPDGSRSHIFILSSCHFNLCSPISPTSISPLYCRDSNGSYLSTTAPWNWQFFPL